MNEEDRAAIKRLARRGLPDCGAQATVADFAGLVMLAREERLPRQMTVWWWGYGSLASAVDYTRVNEHVVQAADRTGEYRAADDEERIYALRCVLRALRRYVRAYAAGTSGSGEEG